VLIFLVFLRLVFPYGIIALFSIIFDYLISGLIVTNGFGDNMAYNCHITALKTSQEELAKKMAVDVQAQFLIDSEVLMGRTYHDGADKNYQGIDYTVTYHSDGTLTVE
jgi:hypothetical protein